MWGTYSSACCLGTKSRNHVTTVEHFEWCRTKCRLGSTTKTCRLGPDHTFVCVGRSGNETSHVCSHTSKQITFKPILGPLSRPNQHSRQRFGILTQVIILDHPFHIVHILEGSGNETDSVNGRTNLRAREV